MNSRRESAQALVDLLAGCDLIDLYEIDVVGYSGFHLHHDRRCYGAADARTYRRLSDFVASGQTFHHCVSASEVFRDEATPLRTNAQHLLPAADALTKLRREQKQGYVTLETLSALVSARLALRSAEPAVQEIVLVLERKLDAAVRDWEQANSDPSDSPVMRSLFAVAQRDTPRPVVYRMFDLAGPVPGHARRAVEDFQEHAWNNWRSSMRWSGRTDRARQHVTLSAASWYHERAKRYRSQGTPKWWKPLFLDHATVAGRCADAYERWLDVAFDDESRTAESYIAVSPTGVSTEFWGVDPLLCAVAQHPSSWSEQMNGWVLRVPRAVADHIALTRHVLEFGSPSAGDTSGVLITTVGLYESGIGELSDALEAARLIGS